MGLLPHLDQAFGKIQGKKWYKHWGVLGTSRYGWWHYGIVFTGIWRQIRHGSVGHEELHSQQADTNPSQKTSLPPGLWRWLWIPRRGCFPVRDIWVEFSFRFNYSSKQYPCILGNVLAANDTTDSGDSSWLSDTETLQIHSGNVWLCLSQCLQLW